MSLLRFAFLSSRNPSEWVDASFPLAPGYCRPEAAHALRQRLNDTVDELDRLRTAHTALEVRCTELDRELTVAKSDRAFLWTRRRVSLSSSFRRRSN